MNTLRILILATVALLVGCNSGFHAKIDGTVRNALTGKPIADVEVRLKDGVDNSGSSLGQGGSTSNESTSIAYTDSNGKFYVELEGEFEPILSVQKDKYGFHRNEFNDGRLIPITQYPDGTTNNTFVEMKPDAYFNPIFQSSTPIDNKTFLVFEEYFPFPHTNDKPGSGFTLGDREIIEWPFDAMLTVGDTYTKFDLIFSRGGQQQTITDSVFIPAFETFRDTIYY
jgi:hypothetical protein